MRQRLRKFGKTAVAIYLIGLAICTLSNQHSIEPGLFMACRDWLMLGIGIAWGALADSILTTLEQKGG